MNNLAAATAAAPDFQGQVADAGRLSKSPGNGPWHGLLRLDFYGHRSLGWEPESIVFMISSFPS